MPGTKVCRQWEGNDSRVIRGEGEESLRRLGIPTVQGQGRYGDERRYNIRRSQRYIYARTLSNLCPIPRDTGVETTGSNPAPTLMFCNGRSIKNKASTLQEYLARHNIDLACLTKTWVRKGKTTALREFAPPGFSVLHQSWTSGRRGGVAILIQESFSYTALHTPKIPGIECVGLGWA